MPITKRIIVQDDNDDNQWLKVDHSSRYVVNDSDDWQWLFGPNSLLSNSQQIIKIAAKFDEGTFNNLKLAAYLYDQQNDAIANAATCEFKVFSITTPNWTETLLATFSGTQLSNQYFYTNPTLASIGTLDFFGGDSIMVQATILRLGVTYRDRVYVNHLGVFDNLTRLRGDVEFLEVTKKDE